MVTSSWEHKFVDKVESWNPWTLIHMNKNDYTISLTNLGTHSWSVPVDLLLSLPSFSFHFCVSLHRISWILQLSCTSYYYKMYKWGCTMYFLASELLNSLQKRTKMYTAPTDVCLYFVNLVRLISYLPMFVCIL